MFVAAAGRVPEVKAVATIGAPSGARRTLRHLFAAATAATIESGGRGRGGDSQGRSFRIKKQFLDDLAEHDLATELSQLGKALLIFHSPLDEIVPIDEARKIFMAARATKSFVSLDQADHLLSRKQDGEYVAAVLTAWASRYLGSGEQQDLDETTSGGVVRVVEQPVRHAQRIVAGHHVLRADEPVSVGGGDTGPDPYGYLLAGLGACTAMTLRMYADHKGWPLEGVSVELEHDRIHARDCESCEAEDGHVSRITKRITVGGALDESQRARLLEIADRCPVNRTLKGEIDMRAELLGSSR